VVILGSLRCNDTKVHPGRGNVYFVNPIRKDLWALEQPLTTPVDVVKVKEEVKVKVKEEVYQKEPTSFPNRYDTEYNDTPSGRFHNEMMLSYWC
jgi:hypothetical protein